MAASDEWEEVHLTPNGWVDGSYKHDFGNRVEEPTPTDAVLTIRRHVYVGAIGAEAKVTETEAPRIDDKAKIAELRLKFGKPTFGC